jgi:hypothetical protein
MAASDHDLRAKKREMEHKISEAVLSFERETNLTVTEITLTPTGTGGTGSTGSHLKTKVELRS